MKMILDYIIFSMVGISYAFSCDFSHCEEYNILDDLQEIRFLPNARELQEHCQELLRILQCKLDVLEKCTGGSINTLTESNDELFTEATSTLLGIRSFVVDICNPNTTLHNDYIANIECFRGFIYFGEEICDLETKQTLEEFFMVLEMHGGKEDLIEDEIDCLKRAYKATCIARRLGQTCGKPARSTFINVVRQLNPVFQTRCSPIPNGLKEKLVLVSEYHDEGRQNMKEVLDLFKRR